MKPSPRLYLVTPLLGDTAPFVGPLTAALEAGDIAAVLLRLEDADERTLINRAKAVAAIVQRREIALLLDGRPELVARAGADGAHLTGIEALDAALPLLKPDRIAGAGGLASRHDAMVAGERGADYVMFGEPSSFSSPHVGERSVGAGRRPSLDAVVERLAWWAELFQPPCIGYAAHLEEVGPLAQTQADFIALGDWVWTHAQGPAAAVAAAAGITTSFPAIAGKGDRA
jgi:thiamine-phosphate pyrophosphorylase